MFAHKHEIGIFRLAPTQQIGEEVCAWASPEALLRYDGLNEIWRDFRVIAGKCLKDCGAATSWLGCSTVNVKVSVTSSLPLT